MTVAEEREKIQTRLQQAGWKILKKEEDPRRATYLLEKEGNKVELYLLTPLRVAVGREPFTGFREVEVTTKTIIASSRKEAFQKEEQIASEISRLVEMAGKEG